LPRQSRGQQSKDGKVVPGSYLERQESRVCTNLVSLPVFCRRPLRCGTLRKRRGNIQSSGHFESASVRRHWRNVDVQAAEDQHKPD